MTETLAEPVFWYVTICYLIVVGIIITGAMLR